jgi:hypothetical protein
MERSVQFNLWSSCNRTITENAPSAMTRVIQR